MIELIKKAMLTGLGVASLTKEKVEEVANDFIEKGKLSEQEGKKLVDELMAKSEESKEDIKKQVDELVGKALAKMEIATKEDIASLRKEILAMKKEE